jgi:iron complex outermembrane receptor protein
MLKKRFCSTPMLVISLSFPLYLSANNDVFDDATYQFSLEDLLNIEVVTASKVAQKLTDVPATVRTFNAKQIEQLGFTNLKDIFRALPGFDVSYDSQGEVRTLVVGRGVLGNQKLTVLQDGRKYSPTTGERFVYGHNTPLSHIKQIEVVYGPASALYGADAFSGVVNMISKDGADIDGIEANVSYVDTGAWVSDFTIGHELDNGLDYIFYLNRYHGKDYQLEDKYSSYAVVNQYDGELGQLPVEYPIENWNLFLDVEYQNWSFGFDWQHMVETNAPTTIPTNYAYVKNNVWGQTLGHGYLKYEHEFSDTLSVNATASIGHYEVLPQSNFYIVQDTQMSSGQPSYKYALSQNSKYEVQGFWTEEGFTIIGGISYEQVQSFPKTKNLDDGQFDTSGPLVDDLSEFVDDNGYTFGLLSLNEAQFGERNYQNAGAYLQGQTNLGENFDITVGARYDTNSIYGSTFNPRFSLIYHHGDTHSSRLTYGSAYIQPANYYRWENWANPFAMHIPNQDISPETVDSTALSTTYFKDNYSIKGEIYYNTLQNVIRPVPANPQADGYPYYNPLRQIIGASPDSGYVEINANQGTINTYGGEIEFTIASDNLTTTLAYSYVSGDDGGFALAKTSKHKVLVNLQYTHQDWTFGSTIRYYSNVNTSAFNSQYGLGGNGELQFSGATVVYANINYSLNDHIKLKLSLDNLFDNSHYGAAPYGESVWIEPKAPQAGRKINLGVEVKW